MSATAAPGAGQTAPAGTVGAPAPAAPRLPFDERVMAELGAFREAVLESCVQRPRRLLAKVRPEAIVEVCGRLKKLGFEHLSCETCVDYETEIEMVYHLWSYRERCLIEIRARISGTEPRVASLVPVWTGAEFHEREAYDMFGVVFEGCPNLRRVLLPEEWTLFPFRKSFKIESIHEKRKRLEADRAKAEKAKAAAATPAATAVATAAAAPVETAAAPPKAEAPK